MCTEQTTEICNQLAAQANELRIVEQHEATIAAALALPEAEKRRLWQLLNEEFASRTLTIYRHFEILQPIAQE